MIANGEGLTKTYNRVHGGDRSVGIERLRELHVALYEAVAEAYGWGDLGLEHGYHGTTQGVRFTISEATQVEVLDRLLELNHERWAGEVAAGLHVKGRGTGKVRRGVVDAGQGDVGRAGVTWYPPSRESLTTGRPVSATAESWC